MPNSNYRSPLMPVSSIDVQVWTARQPVDANCGYGEPYPYRIPAKGYEDPRLFEVAGRVYVLANGCYNGGRHMFLIDPVAQTVARLWVRGSAVPEPGAVEKNWTPYADRGRIRIVYSFGVDRALGVLEVVNQSTGECAIVSGNLTYDHGLDKIGSTQLVQWLYPLYVGYGHVRHGPQHPGETVGLQPGQAFQFCYRALPVVFNAETFAIGYGEPVTFGSPPHVLARPGEGLFKDVQFPYYIELDARGDVLLGIEYQDRYPVWARINGMDFSKTISQVVSRL